MAAATERTKERTKAAFKREEEEIGDAETAATADDDDDVQNQLCARECTNPTKQLSDLATFLC